MANEIWHSSDEANSLYALVWRQTDDKVWNNTDGTWDTYTDADIDKYDLPLTNHVDSDYHSVDFPSAIAKGTYRVQVMQIAGGAMDADADKPAGQGELYWDGASEVNMLTEIHSWEKNG